MSEVTGETIVVGFDGSDCGEQALRWAIVEAERSGRELLIVLVWHWSNAVAAAPLTLIGIDVDRAAAADVLERAASEARSRGVHVHTRLLEGFGADPLVAMADGAAMLVVGSHGYRPLTRAFLGSVSRDCVLQALCPVVVVPTRAVLPVLTDSIPNPVRRDTEGLASR